MSTKVQQKNIN